MSKLKSHVIAIHIPAGVDIVGNNPIRQILAAIEPEDSPFDHTKVKPIQRLPRK